MFHKDCDMNTCKLTHEKKPSTNKPSLSKTRVKPSGYRPVIYHTGSHFVPLNSDSQRQSSTGALVCRRERKKCRPSLSATKYMRPNRQKLLDTHWHWCACCTDLLKSKCLPHCSWLCTAGRRVCFKNRWNVKYGNLKLRPALKCRGFSAIFENLLQLLL